MGQSSKTIAVIATLAAAIPVTALTQTVGTVAAGVTPSGTAATVPGATPAATPPAPPAAPRVPLSGPIPNPGGLQIDIGVRSSLTTDDNFTLVPNSPGSSQIWDNTFTFGLSSITALDNLNVLASGVLRYADIPGRTTEGFEDPTLTVDYSRTGVDSLLQLHGQYRSVDREFLDPFQVQQETQNTPGLAHNGGTLDERAFGLSYQTGMNAPVGFRFTADQYVANYSNAPAVTVFDNETDTFSATVDLKVSPVTKLSFGAKLADYNASDSVMTERRTVDYTVGLVQDVNPNLLLDAQVGVTDIDTQTISGTTSQSATTGALKLTQTMPNGTAFVGYDRTLNQNGSSDTFRFGRDLQLRAGVLSAMLGVTRTPNNQNHVIGTVTYTYPMRSSTIDVSLDRNVWTNGINQDILDTRVSVTYDYLLNSSSSLQFALDWGRTESAGIGNAATVELTSLKASYTRQLTADWNLTGGAILRKNSDSSVAGTANSTALFLTLDRNFSFRP
ncbi:MAG: hypothetical protein H6895_01830 [Defluviimonas sp.]|uniref:hypothetical protein n=1 Tax=Albidovulum sp. TaxID=1872424 RepID=UPI002A251CA1|nr:hypothetical protein [Defluviimonas sp.]